MKKDFTKVFEIAAVFIGTVVGAGLALGYTMVYGIIKLINFAHGDIYMIGAFIGLYCGKNLGLSLLPTLIISMIGAALCGVIIEKVAYKPLRNSQRITLLITAIGISLLLENGMKLAVGSSPKAFPKLLSTEVIKLGSLSLEIIICFPSSYKALKVWKNSS